MSIQKIISGGQSGVDQAALFAATLLSLSTGGFAAQGWQTESGSAKELLEGYGLKECARPGYPARTEANVRASDATVIISNERKLTGGSYGTECVAESLDKPVWRVWVNGHGVEEFVASGSRLTFAAWAAIHSVRVLNVAGPRASKWAGGEEATVEWLMGRLGGSE